MNEIIFLFQTIIISVANLLCLYIGQEALLAFVCVQCLLANLFVLKQITLFGLTATASDAFTIGATVGLNLLQEYFGKAIARKTILINGIILLLYTVISQLHLRFTPATCDIMQRHYEPLFSCMPRIVIASISVYLIVQLIDYLLYGLLRKLWRSRFLVLRNYTSIGISQLIDTVLFSFFGLYGLVANIAQIIVVSYFIKLCALALTGPFIAVSRKIK